MLAKQRATQDQATIATMASELAVNNDLVHEKGKFLFIIILTVKNCIEQGDILNVVNVCT